MSAEHIPAYLHVCDRLGQTLGTLPSLGKVEIFVDGVVSIRGLCLLVGRMKQLKSLEWELHKPDATLIGIETDYEALSDALMHATGLERIVFHCKLGYDSDAEYIRLFGCLLSSDKDFYVSFWMPQLDHLRTYYLMTAECVSLARMLRAQSIKSLELIGMTLETEDDALRFNQAISGSELVELRVSGGEIVQVPNALGSQSLRTLDLDNIIVDSFDESLVFCRALLALTLSKLKLSNCLVHDAAEDQYCRAICIPGLSSLEVYHECDTDGDKYTPGIAASLKQCTNLQSLRLYAPSPHSNGALLDTLEACCAWPDLQTLDLPPCSMFSTQVDQALAKCLHHCPKLSRLTMAIYSIDIGCSEEASIGRHFLAACRTHTAITYIHFSNDGHESHELDPREKVLLDSLSAQLDRITCRIKETIDYRPRFEAITKADGLTSALIAQALCHVRDKPHLIHLGLVVNCRLISEQSAAPDSGMDWAIELQD